MSYSAKDQLKDRLLLLSSICFLLFTLVVSQGSAFATQPEQADAKNGQAHVLFSPNGASGKPIESQAESGKTIEAPQADAFMRAGFHIAGWNELPNGKGEELPPASKLSVPSQLAPGSEIVFYARWEANNNTAYIVQHYKQDMLGAFTLSDTDEFTGVTNEIATATARNYMGYHLSEFLGDYAMPPTISPEGNTVVKLYYEQNSQNTSQRDNEQNTDGILSRTAHVVMDMLTQCKSNSSIVSFDSTRGNGEMESFIVVFGAPSKLPECSFERAGYSFAGWAKAPGEPPVYEDEADLSSEKLDEREMLYACWKPITYELVFSPGSGQGNISKQTVTYDTNTLLKANTFSNPGFSFAGWKDDKGNLYSDKQEVMNLTSAQGETVSLTAQWEPDTYTVTFIANEQRIEKETSYGKAVVPPQAPDKTGFIFKKWDADTSSVVSDMTVNAIYEPISYKVVYRANGQDVSVPSEQTMTYSQEPDIPNLPSDADTGYTFTSWNTSADGSGSPIAPGPTEPLASQDGTVIELFAQWTTHAHEISFVDQDGEIFASQSVEHKKLPAPPSAPRVTGHVFSHWNPEMSAATSDASYTAVYLPISYSIVFDGRGAESPESLPRTYGDKVALPELERNGFSFLGWNTAADGSGTYYPSGFLGDISESQGDIVKLYAQWGAKSNQVRFLAQDSSVISVQDVEYGTSASAPELPALENKKVLGWNVDFSAVKAPADITAMYSDANYTVSYDPNCEDELDPISAQTMTLGQPAPIAAGWADGSRSGYTFDSWNTQRDGNGTTYRAGQEAELSNTAGEKVILYAQWSALTSHKASYVGTDRAAIELTEKLPEVIYGTSVILPSLSASRYGEPFLGWSLDGGQTVVDPGKSLTFAEDVPELTFSAIWGDAPYKIILNADASWTHASDVSLTIASDAPFDKFSCVRIDTDIVMSECYDAKSGSTEITFGGDFLDSLDIGKHEVEIASSDGSAITTLTVLPAEEKKEGDGTPGASRAAQSGSGMPSTGDTVPWCISALATVLASLLSLSYAKRGNRGKREEA